MCAAQPGSSLVSRTRVKTLASETVAANARFFGGDLSKVPTMALTVGVGTVMDAQEVLVLITGACFSCVVNIGFDLKNLISPEFTRGNLIPRFKDP